jgi:hypothetical protein
MGLRTPSPRTRRILLISGALLLVGLLVLPWIATPLIGARLRDMAADRGYDVNWRSLSFRWPLGAEVREFRVSRHDGPGIAVHAERVAVSLAPRFLRLRPRITRLELDGMSIRLPAASEGEGETAPTRDEDARGPAAPRVRAAAEQFAQALLLPARRFPEVMVTSLDVHRGDSLFARLDALTLQHRGDGLQFAAAGLLATATRVPFDVALDWHRDDRLTGRASFDLGGAESADTRLDLSLEGLVTQDRRAGVVRIAEGTKLRIGDLALALSGDVTRAGPRFRFDVRADGLSAEGVQQSVPPAMLGPLDDLTVRGTWDWHASLDVDVARPESTRFTADVTPHRLTLGPDGARVPLRRLSGPFLAAIHVPSGTVHRDLSPANPDFRPLDRISPLLREALLTNEDGGFYRHRGFNTAAIQGAIAENLRAGAFRRGAGTITMQLARNLFLGHQRTLSRKGQEVVLAWVLEHLTGLPKDRLFEIYLNIIEWGPGVHGASEAARYYFARDPAELTLDEALFLTVLVPSPNRWRTRVDAHGALRPWARAQMAFIARKMNSRGVLAPELVPAAESLHVELQGAAAALMTPVPVPLPPPAPLPADSLKAEAPPDS